MRISISKVFFACVLVGGATYGISTLRGPHATSEKRQQIDHLELENQILLRKIADKQSYLDRLEKNPDELSLEIKRRLGLVNKGSKNFILQDGAKADGSPKPKSGPAR